MWVYEAFFGISSSQLQSNFWQITMQHETRTDDMVGEVIIHAHSIPAVLYHCIQVTGPWMLQWPVIYVSPLPSGI